MSIDLSAIRIATFHPAPLDFGGPLVPQLGGPTQEIDRLGSRWIMRFTTPPVVWAEEGETWAALLDDAAKSGGLIAIPQPGAAIGNPGVPVVGSPAVGGRLLALAGLAPGFLFKPGRWLSIVKNGRRYADRVVQSAAASGGGTATMKLRNQLRVALVGGETVEIAVPKVEGRLTEWDGAPMDADALVTLSFAIEESE